MRIWITRAEPGASRTANKVRALGHEPVVEPLLEARPLPGEIDLRGVAALAFTSANGVRAFAARSSERALKVFAVGDATAEAARGAGFTEVVSAGGDVQALAAVLAARRDELAGAVLAPGPKEPAGDLVGALAAAGLPARAQALYETVPREPPADLSALDAVLIHSPKAARRLADLASTSRSLAAFCISQAAAAPLRPLGLASIAVARAPDEAALLALLPPP